MLPLQNDLGLPAAKQNNHATHAPAAARNLDAAIPLLFARAELHQAKELRTTATQMQLQNRISRHAQEEKRPF